MGLEIMREVESMGGDPDIIFVAIGGGGMIAGGCRWTAAAGQGGKLGSWTETVGVNIIFVARGRRHERWWVQQRRCGCVTLASGASRSPAIQQSCAKTGQSRPDAQPYPHLMMLRLQALLRWSKTAAFLCMPILTAPPSLATTARIAAVVKALIQLIACPS